jgi:endonuclease YncB( thermonuclease family)
MTSTQWLLWAFTGGALATWVSMPRRSKEGTMRNRRAIGVFLGLLIFGAGLFPAFAGDSLYGKVTAVKSANVATLDYGTGKYDIRLIGIDVPKEGPLAREATQFVSKMVLEKNARMRFEGRTPNGEMLARLFTDDPVIGIKDVGLELVRAGLARRQEGKDERFGYKYGELAAAEREAQKARRGLWATTQLQ